MKSTPFRICKLRNLLCGLLLLLEAPQLLAAEPTAANLAAFDRYTQALEARLAQQHRSAPSFLATAADQASTARLRQGALLIDHLAPPATPGALLHHWRGTAFVPGAHAEDFERILRDFRAYPQNFAPEVIAASATGGPGSAAVQATLRIRQHHVITVLMDTAYDVTFGQLDLRHGYSISRSTHITELDPGTAKPAEDHGFLWRLNTYWSYEERDDGLYLQVESVSLSRAIPRGLGWAVSPFVESIPRESLEFTLRSAAAALRKPPTTLTAQRTTK